MKGSTLGPDLSLAQRAAIGAIRAYRLVLSPWLGNACRFEPTCSVYAIGATERYGVAIGSALAAGRILRCHPWCEGGVDPVPAVAPRLFTSLPGLGRPARTPPRSAAHVHDTPSP